MSSDALAGPADPWFAGALRQAVTAGVQSVFSEAFDAQRMKRA